MLNGEGSPGAVVAIEPKTGAIRTMASTPSYDPNTVPENIEALNADGSGSPLVNRATQNPYPPGSTMKVVTAAAALDSGEFTPDSTVDGSSPQDVSGVPLQNFGNESFGEITLTDALTNSVNTVWANVGEELGAETMVEYMERFGFYSRPEFDYPEDQVRASGPTKTNGRLATEGFDVGRVAIGQGGAEGHMLATPLQMAKVAATVGNDGVQKRPTFLQEVKDPDGRVTDELDPDEVRRVISEESAAQLTQMMINVTEEGTASGLSVGGAQFAGKTGTAERDNAGLNQPWFVLFAPAEDPQIAVAATIESCQGCSGGQIAGPIATAVAQDLLG
jgi:peptidoglycan glycosyltransferase